MSSNWGPHIAGLRWSHILQPPCMRVVILRLSKLISRLFFSSCSPLEKIFWGKIWVAKSRLEGGEVWLSMTRALSIALRNSNMFLAHVTSHSPVLWTVKRMRRREPGNEVGLSNLCKVPSPLLYVHYRPVGGKFLGVWACCWTIIRYHKDLYHYFAEYIMLHTTIVFMHNNLYD